MYYFYRSDFEAVIELERVLANRNVRGHRSGLEEGRIAGFAAGNHSAQLRCSAAQNIELQGLRDRVLNYRSLVRGQERQINQLQRLLGQAEDALRTRLQAEVANIMPQRANLVVRQSADSESDGVGSSNSRI